MKTNEDNIRNIVREMMKREKALIFGTGVFFYGYVITKALIMSSHSFISGFFICGVIVFDIYLMNIMIKRDI